MAAAVVLLALFVVSERRSQHPVITPSLFCKRSFVIGLLALWWSVAHWGAGITVWKLAPALVLTGFGSGLVFVPLFDFILGEASAEEVGTGAGLLNVVQQFAGAIGVAALGTVFFTRVGHPSAVPTSPRPNWSSASPRACTS